MDRNNLGEELQPVRIGSQKDDNRKGIGAVITAAFIIVLIGLIGVFVPSMFSILWLITRYLLLMILIVFLMISLLVFVGFRKQAKELLFGLINGTLTSLDILREIRNVIREMLLLLKQFILKFLPVYAFLLALIIYFGLIYLYKSVGQNNDVTLLTIILSSVLMLAIAFLNKPKDPATVDRTSATYRFSRYFNDSLEIMVFVFFLTMDSTQLFFLPERLNTELHAMLGDYNLMIRGFMIDESIWRTINIILFTIGLEVFRQFLRIFVYSRRYYNVIKREDPNTPSETILKKSLSQGFSDNIDDILKFVTYFTFLVVVFLFFPRLKLLAMLVVSATSLFADLLIPSRLTAERQEDLIGRLFSKLFGV